MPLAPPPLTPLGFFSDSEKIYIPAISPSTKSHKLTPLSEWLSGIRRGAKKLTILSLLGLSLWFIVLFLFISIHIIPHTHKHIQTSAICSTCVLFIFMFFNLTTLPIANQHHSPTKAKTKVPLANDFFTTITHIPTHFPVNPNLYTQNRNKKNKHTQINQCVLWRRKKVPFFETFQTPSQRKVGNTDDDDALSHAPTTTLAHT